MYTNFPAWAGGVVMIVLGLLLAFFTWGTGFALGGLLAAAIGVVAVVVWLARRARNQEGR
jgi:ABC-type transport system involved in cytochrome bd biosynthesis fused ATPase/permease subunit